MELFPKPSADSPPMYDSALIDRFSRTHWYLVPLVHLPFIAWCLYQGIAIAGIDVGPSLAIVASGWLVWSLTEYWLHRTLFHWRPPARWGERFHFLLHGVHHDWPRDKYRLVMPLVVSASLGVAFLLLFELFLGSAVWPFMAGFGAGYVTYDLTHYAIHHRPAKGRVLKALRKHHLMHHSPRHGERKFGVSTTLWDHVFGTYD